VLITRQSTRRRRADREARDSRPIVWQPRRSWRNDVRKVRNVRDEPACDSDSLANGADSLMTSAEKGTRKREETKNGSQRPGREREKTRQWSVEKRAGQNGRTCDSMRFTAALRRFIAPSKHKMPGREACMRVGTPPLHFYRWLPVKPGNIPRFLALRSRPAISNLFPLPSTNAVTGFLIPFLFRLHTKFTLFLISCILFATSFVSKSSSSISLAPSHSLKCALR